MTFIRYISEDMLELGGMVATQKMIEDGWFEYDGDIPQGNHFKLIDGVLVAFEPEKSDSQKYHDALDYLKATDHKTYTDYEIKPGEVLEEIMENRKNARQFVREYLSKYHIPSP